MKLDLLASTHLDCAPYVEDDVHRSFVPWGLWPAVEQYFHVLSSSPLEIDVAPIRDMVGKATDEQKALYSSTMGVFRGIWAAQDRLPHDKA